MLTLDSLFKELTEKFPCKNAYTASNTIWLTFDSKEMAETLTTYIRETYSCVSYSVSDNPPYKMMVWLS